MKTYASLYKRYKDQPHNEVFAFFPYDSAVAQNWESPFKELAAPPLAKPEEWDFHRPEFKRPGQDVPVLTSYLNYTFLRLQEQGRIAYSRDGKKACFNTGLQTLYEKDIFATFRKTAHAAERKMPDWTHAEWCDSYSKKLTDFRPLPELASYIEDASDLVFDTTYDIDFQTDHIYETNEDRLPTALKGNRSLAVAALEGAGKLLKDKVKRNYKIAIPHWYEEHIQLLLPLKLDDSDPSAADLALVADKDKVGKLYRIVTALSMDMAYIDARLITRPDREWPQPMTLAIARPNHAMELPKRGLSAFVGPPSRAALCSSWRGRWADLKQGPRPWTGGSSNDGQATRRGGHARVPASVLHQEVRSEGPKTHPLGPIRRAQAVLDG